MRGQSRGRGYRGAAGEDGTYRADGCAACHMPYANDGLSQSSDASIDHEQPGHSIIQRCIDCHVKSEVMGDGNLWGHMDQATKIECRTCHGTGL